MGGMRLPQAGRVNRSAAAAVGAQAVGQNALIGTAASQQDSAGAVAEQRISLDVVGIHHARIGVAADDEGQVAGAGDDVSRARDQGVHEAGAGGFHFNGGAVQLQPILHQACRRRERHVRREGAEDDQIDVLFIDAGGGDAALGGLVTEIAGGLVGQGVAAFEDAGALDDPVGIEAEPLLKVFIGNHRVRNVTAARQDANTCQASAARSRQRRTFFAHGNLNRDERHP